MDVLTGIFLEIDSDDADMAENGVDLIAEGLEAVAKHIRDGGESGVIRDANGNCIGRWGLEYSYPGDDEY